MKPPKLNSRATYSGREIRSRWMSCDEYMAKLPKKWQGEEEYGLRILIVDDICQRIKGGELIGEIHENKRFKSERDVTLRGDELEKLEHIFFKDHDQSLLNGYYECERDDYPPELEIALNAWRAVAIHGQGEGGTPKQRLINWLETHYKDLMEEQVKRIATVCNWDKERGRKKL